MHSNKQHQRQGIQAAYTRSRALTVALTYAGFASLWILLSDKALEWLLGISPHLTTASTLKGWLFVVVTSLLLYGLLIRLSGRPEASVDADSSQPSPRWPMWLIAICIVALTTAVIVHTMQAEKQRVGSQLSAIGHYKSQLVERWLAERHADAQMIRDGAVFPLLASGRQAQEGGAELDRLAGLLGEYHTYHGYENVMLFDAASTLRWTADGDEPPIDPRLQTAIAKAHADDLVTLFGPHRGGGMTLIDFVIALGSKGTGDRATVVLRSNLDDHLAPLLKTFDAADETVEVILFRREGDQVQWLSDSRGRAEGGGSPISMVAELAAMTPHQADRHGQILEGADERGGDVVGVVLPIAGTDWFLLSKANLAEVHRKIGPELLWIAMAGMLTIAAVSVAMRLAQQYARLATTIQERARHRLLSQMSGMARIGGWEFDVTTGSGSWTEETARIHEVPPDQEASVAFGLGFYQGESRQRIEDAIRTAIDTGEPYDLELEMLTARGRHKWVRTLGMPVKKGDRVVRLEGAIQDITEQKETELLLVRERGLLKTLIQTLPDLIWLKDTKGRYITCNPRFERFFGATEAEIVGKSDDEFISRELADAFRANDQAAVAAGGPVVNQEVIPFADDGHEERVETIKTPMFDAEGHLIGVLGIARNITSLFEAQEDLRIALGRNRRYLETAQNLMVAVDANGCVTMINRAGREILGYEENELLGRNWFETCLPQPEGMEEVYPVFRSILADGAENSGYEYFENSILCRDGSQRLVAWRSAVVRDEAGLPTGVLGSGEDVTERRQAEQALRESEEKTRLLLESTAEAIYGVDAEGRFTFANPACVHLLGYDSDEALLGQPSHTLMHHSRADGAPYPRHQCRVYRAFRTNQGVHVDDEVFWRRDGSCIPVEYWAYPIRRDDKVVGTVVAWLDITERRAAEAQLRKLSQAVEQSTESIVITDIDGRIEYVNAAFLRNTGYSHHEVIGRNPRVLQSGRTPRQTYEEMWAAISAGRPWKGTFHNRRRDGSEYSEFAIVSPITGQDGRVTHYVAAKEDITEKQRVGEELNKYRNHLEELVAERTAALAEARERADAANHAKSAFLANMSHEIRTPMNGVIGLLDVLERSGLSDHQDELVHTIRQSAATLLGLIDDILDLSKIEAGRMNLEFLPVAVSDIVEGVCSSLVASTAKNDIRFGVFVEPQIPRVMTDALRLRQVLYNLIGNAIKFTGGKSGRRGVVWVSASVLHEKPLWLRFQVEDNGIGMSEETVQSLFNAFTQGEISTTRRFGGTGLGLTICRRVVDLMEGDIDVESTPDVGSRFTVDLPFEPAGNPVVADDPDLTGLHCIILEQDARFANGLAAYLLHAGAEISLKAEMPSPDALTNHAPGSYVLICPDDIELTGSGNGSPPPTDLPVVLIRHGRNRGPCAASSHGVTIEGNGLRRQVLLRSVAIAAGRASPEVVHEPNDIDLIGTTSPAPSVSEARAQGRLILVAEDDAVNQLVILHQLELLGHAAEVAHNGVEALDLWRDGGYALLLTDLHMPEMDGYQLTAAIRREQPPDSRFPILALTANALRGEAQRATEAGMNGYLTKPVTLDRLKQALDTWLPNTTPVDAQLESGNPLPVPAEGIAKVVDVSVLEGLVGDDRQIIHGLLTQYRDTARGYAKELHVAGIHNDIAEIGAIAHKLKSASRSVGALALGDLCAGLENAAKTGDSQTALEELNAFDSAFAQVDEAIDQLVRESRNE
ncbi:MAG: PAS domain S-box protein [Sedimenticolaceae bacterium]